LYAGRGGNMLSENTKQFLQEHCDLVFVENGQVSNWFKLVDRMASTNLSKSTYLNGLTIVFEDGSHCFFENAIYFDCKGLDVYPVLTEHCGDYEFPKWAMGTIRAGKKGG
jgi:hypothetical protein